MAVRRRTMAGLAVGSALLAAGPLPAHAGPLVNYQVVAVSDQTLAPGTSSTFLSLWAVGAGGPALAGANQAILVGDYGATPDLGLFLGTSGGLSLIARTNPATTAPGAGQPFLSFTTSFSPSANPAGQVAFYGAYTGGEGLFLRATGGTLSALARTGVSTDVGGASVTFASFAQPVLLNRAGRAAYQAAYAAGAQTGLFTTLGSTTQRLVGTDVGAVPGAGTALFESFSDPVLNEAGRLAFQAGYSLTEQGIFVADAPGAVTAIARSSVPAAVPGADPAYFFTEFSPPSLNNPGRVAFSAHYGDGASVSEGGLFVTTGPGGPLLSLARTDGANAPGTTARFSGFGNPVLNGRNQVAFHASFNDNLDNGIFLADEAGALDALAITGPTADPAPGTPWDFSTFGDPALNLQGAVAFLATLADPEGRAGLWATDGQGPLRLVALTGDLWDLDGLPGGASRVISQVALLPGAGGDDGRPSPWNDSNLLTFGLVFTDGTSAVYIAQVPEPATLALAAAILPWALLRRRRS